MAWRSTRTRHQFDFPHRSRDFYLSAHEAVQYGLIDKVLIPQPKGMGGGGLGLGDGLSSFV